jgi:transcriptional regulator with XRE-family HTH domain
MYRISLEAARVNAKMSQKDAALAIDVNVSTIRNWETGKTSPDADKFKELCSIYGCPMDLIFLGKELT